MQTSAPFSLKRNSPSEQLAARVAMAPATPHVLVVEDDADCSRGLSIWLESLGHSVTAIGNGAEALRWIEDEEPRVVLLDLGLPGMHGFKILHEMRMRGLVSPVVVLTAKAAPDVVAQAKALGALEVLSKPVEDSSLRAILADLLPESSGSRAMGRGASRRDTSSWSGSGVDIGWVAGLGHHLAPAQRDCTPRGAQP